MRNTSNEGQVLHLSLVSYGEEIDDAARESSAAAPTVAGECAEAVVAAGFEPIISFERRRWSGGWMLRSPAGARLPREQQLALGATLAEHGWNVAFLTPALASGAPGLIVTDGDSTLLRGEAIDELAAAAGVGEHVAAITARAMHGELDFAASLRERVRTLAGLPLTEVDARVPSLTPGAEALIRAAHAAGWRISLVSGGFTRLLEPLVDRYGIDAMAANILGIDSTSAVPCLNGTVIGDIVDGGAKANYLSAWAEEFGVPLDQTVAIGDGANDLPMMAVAGVGVAFCAKPRVRAATPSTISVARMDVLAALLGLDV